MRKEEGRPGAGESRVQHRRGRIHVPTAAAVLMASVLLHMLHNTAASVLVLHVGIYQRPLPSSVTEALPAGPCSAPFAQGAGGKPAVKAQKVLLSPGSPEPSSPALQGA